MTPRSVEPALTAEEWAELCINRRDHDTVTLSAKTGGITVEDGCEGGYIDNGDRHALAALALHDQPFGFSREDVQTLRDVSARLREDGFMHEDVDSLAARIAALLPPDLSPESLTSPRIADKTT